MKNHTRNILMAAVVILSLVTIGYSGASAITLPVPVVEQEQSEWCWAAAARSTLLYFSTDVTQCDIADWARVQGEWGEDDCCSNPDGAICNQANLFSGAAGSLESILQNWGVETALYERALSGAEIQSVIGAGTPFLMRWAWTGGGAHVVSGRGYTGNTIHYVDPWPGIGYQSADYNWIMTNDDHEWTHTLGDVCLPPGDGDVTGDAWLNIGDVVALWDYVYVNGPPPVGGLYVGNTDGCCFVDIGDIGFLGKYIFKGGPPPPGAVTCLGSANGDEVELRLVSPPVAGEPDSVVRVDLYVKNNYPIVAASMGFEWDNPDLRMDSSKVSPLVQGGFMMFADRYYLQNIDSTNAYRRFLFAAGLDMFSSGIGGSPDSRLWVSYFFTALNWTNTSVMRIDLAEFTRGAQLKLVWDSGGNHIPTFLGALAYANEGILRPEPGALVHLGQEYPVEWSASEVIEAFTVDLSRDDGSNWENLVTGHAGTTFLWTVAGDTTSEALIRVYDADDPAPADTMFSGLFTITDTVFISLTDPGGGLRADAKTPTIGSVDADLRRDGPNSDLLVLYDNGIVDFFSGQGDGTFDESGTEVITVDAPATDMAVADIDEDGHLDAAVASALNSVVSLHFGAGNGTFSTGPGDTITTTGTPIDVALSDINRDGNLDLVVTTETPHQLLLYSGAGNGSFASIPAVLPLAGIPDGLACGFLTNDAIPDLAVVHGESGTVSVFEGTATGSFDLMVEVPTGEVAADLVVSDLNSDGVHDVGVIYSGNHARFMILLNDGANGFDTTSYNTILDGHSAVLTGDFTADGLIDAAIASRTHDSLIILAALPGGGFGYPLLHQVGDEPIGISCSDFDADGLTDLLVANRGSMDVTVLLGSMQTPLSVDLAVTSPAGGEDWETDTDQQISWTKGEGVAAVNVEISRDAGQSWQPVVQDITSTTFSWMVSGPATSTALIRVVDRTVPSRIAASADYFTISLAFECGDIDTSGGIPNISDLTYLVDYMFGGGPPPPIIDIADVDASGEINVSDITYLVDYLFGGGPAPVCP